MELFHSYTELKLSAHEYHRNSSKSTGIPLGVLGFTADNYPPPSNSKVLLITPVHYVCLGV